MAIFDKNIQNNHALKAPQFKKLKNFHAVYETTIASRVSQNIKWNFFFVINLLLKYKIYDSLSFSI